MYLTIVCLLVVIMCLSTVIALMSIYVPCKRAFALTSLVALAAATLSLLGSYLAGLI